MSAQKGKRITKRAAFLEKMDASFHGGYEIIAPYYPDGSAITSRNWPFESL